VAVPARVRPVRYLPGQLPARQLPGQVPRADREAVVLVEYLKGQMGQPSAEPPGCNHEPGGCAVSTAYRWLSNTGSLLLVPMSVCAIGISISVALQWPTPNVP
jgi:hypothetical protein